MIIVKSSAKYKRLYRIWHGMKDRCYNKNNSNYKHYGGRGIRVYDDWYSNFYSFYYWAINHGYEQELTLDRIDNNGNYEPTNCRWATYKQQANNRRNTIYINLDGQIKSLNEWSEINGCSISALRHKIKTGMDPNMAIETSIIRDIDISKMPGINTMKHFTINDETHSVEEWCEIKNIDFNNIMDNLKIMCNQLNINDKVQKALGILDYTN